eukprot:INCI3599.3.p1 GENE.INCI3599.3~~INCI3599.3.p1  ORF type:complete len:261 (-),score=38.86 INCI3599.3:351-1133(-)
MPPSSRRLRIDVLTPNIGAELSGVDLNTDLDAYLAEEIYAALIKHKVIFFRDQDLAPEAHLKLAKAFGEPEPPHPVYPHLPKYPRVTVLKSGGGTVPDTADWHKDMTFRENPPFTSILHAVKVPPTGGDTLWMDAHAAYEALPPGWKLMLDGLDAIHDIGTFRNDFLKKGGVSAVNEALKETGSAVHKVVGTHPVTGEKFLDVNTSFTRHIVGLVQGESDRVLQFLFQHLARPDFQVCLLAPSAMRCSARCILCLRDEKV